MILAIKNNDMRSNYENIVNTGNAALE